MLYQKAAIYLRVHGVELDKGFQDPRKTNKIEKDDGVKFMSYEESIEDFTTMAIEKGSIRPFEIFWDFPRVRKSKHIHSKIWRRLSEEIQAEYRAVKKELKSHNKKGIPKPNPIAPHYGLNKNAKKTTKEDNRRTIATLVNSVESLNVVDTFSNDDTSSDDDDTRITAMIVSNDDQIEVQANQE